MTKKVPNKKLTAQRQITTTIGDGERMAAWGDNHALLAVGKGSICVSAASDTIARAGALGVIALPWFEEKKKRWRMSVGYIGETLKPDVWYKLDKNGRFVETKAD